MKLLKKIFNPKIVEIINYCLIVLLMFYSIFLNSIDFNYDYLIILLCLINFKKIILFLIKNGKVFVTCVILYIIFIFVQSFILNDYSFSFTNVYSYRYIAIKPLLPFVIAAIVMSLNIDENKKIKLNHFFLCFLIISLIYGFCNYLFNFNLSLSGAHLFSESNGRIQSFFTTPLGYGTFMNSALAYVLFSKKIKNLYFKYLLIFSIVVSICLTFGRYNYALMLIIIFIYFISLILRKQKGKLFQIATIIIIVFSTFFLPDNDYLFYSVTDKFDQVFNTKLSATIIKITNKNEDAKNNIYYKLIQYNESENSSLVSRKVYKNTSMEIFYKNKFIGVSELNFYNLERDILQDYGYDYVVQLPHNNYVFFLACNGYIGTAVILSIFLSFLWMIRKICRKKMFAPALIFSIFIVGNFFGDLFIRPDRSFITFIIIGMTIIETYKSKEHLT